jgi:TonB family protein
MPEYPGGQDQLMQDISNRVSYPAEAAAARVTGSVLVSFVVRADGRAEGFEVVRCPTGQAGQEAAVNSLKEAALSTIVALPGMNRWTPARVSGHVVDMKMTIPITFAL